VKQFQSNKIFLDSETVAEQLRSARQSKGLKIEDVAQKLNISKKYLEALEKGNLNELPTGVYGKNFLREYSLFLGLDYNELINTYQKELDIGGKSPQKELFSRQVAKVRYFLTTPKIIKNFIIAIVVIVCFAYLGFAIKKIISPPYLFVENPYENLITNDKTISINGIAEAESQILINGKHVLSDATGRFAETVNLKDGINIITITAKKKYGRENTVNRQILVKEE
jgi:transcriptional regulator with XRE-family HTH domain